MVCLPLLPLAVLALFPPKPAAGVADGHCYQFGSAGWDLIWWGDPDVRLPEHGAIPICNTGFGAVLFRWHSPQGVCLLPSEQCPAVFTNDTCQDLAPLSDSNESGFSWLPPSDPAPASYWITSPAPGACQSGVKVRVDVVQANGPSVSAAGSTRQQGWLTLVAALAAALALAT